MSAFYPHDVHPLMASTKILDVHTIGTFNTMNKRAYFWPLFALLCVP